MAVPSMCRALCKVSSEQSSQDTGRGRRMRPLGRRQQWRSHLGCQPHRENRARACERTTETFPFILFFRSKKVPPPRGITLLSSGGCQRTCGSFLKPPSSQQRKSDLLSHTRSQSRVEELVQMACIENPLLARLRTGRCV